MVRQESTYLIVGHRGLRMLAPENSVTALELACDQLGACEFDVTFTSDEVPVCIHQETMQADFERQRLQLGKRGVANNWVANHTSAEICSLDAGSWLAPEFANVRVPRLTEVLNTLKQRALLFIELIDPNYFGDQAMKADQSHIHKHIKQTVPILKQYAENGGRFALLSFNEKLLEEVSDFLSDVPLVWNLWWEWQGRVAEALLVAQRLKVRYLAVALPMLLADPEWLKACTAAKIELFVYEVSPAYGEEPVELDSVRADFRRALQLGVRNFTVDHVDLLRSELAMNDEIQTILSSPAGRLLRKFSRDPGTTDLHREGNEWDDTNALSLLKEYVPDLSERIKNKVVLDFGCGEGMQALALAKAGAQKVIGLDTNAEAITRAEQRARAVGLAGKVIFSSALGDQWPGKIDVVISQNSMEHFPEPLPILQEMRRLISDTGEIIISFGPPWYAPFGSHMHFFTRIPWVNLLFSEKVVMAVRTLYRDDGARRYEEVAYGLNKMSLAKLESLLKQADLKIKYQYYRGVKKFDWMTKIPVLRELMTNHVTVIVGK